MRRRLIVGAHLLVYALVAGALAVCLARSTDGMSCVDAGGHETLQRFEALLTTSGLVLVPITSCEIQ